MKKYLIVCLGILLVLTVGCSNTSEKNNNVKVNEVETVEAETLDIETPEKIQETIQEISNSFNKDLGDMNIEGLINDYTYSPEMNDFMIEKTIVELFDQMNLGQVVKQESPLETTQNGYIIIGTPTVFENKQLTVNVVFNDKNEIAGFNYGLYENVDDSVSDLSIEALSLKHLNAFADGDYALLMTDFVYTDKMLEIVSEAMYKQTREGLLSGKILEVKEPFEYEIQGYVVVSIPVVFEKIKINYNLVFDNKKIIAGSNLGEYEERVTRNMPESITETKMVSEVNDMSLDGILTTPNEGSNFPVVIFVHGSGASDKDETIYNNKPFRDIAWGLAERGVASYRYDKSNFSNPEKFVNDNSITLYEETINDAVAIANQIKALDYIDRVYILGHSLGGYAMPLIAEEFEADGFVIMAGPTRPLDVLIEEQMNYIFNIDRVVTEEEKAFMEATMVSLGKIRALDFESDDENLFGATKAYWSFLASYDPVESAKSMTSPVLVLQGERDYQVTMDDYNGWFDGFGLEDNWSFKTYEKLTHLMMPGEGQPTNTEYTITNTVDPQVIEDISNWILGQ